MNDTERMMTLVEEWIDRDHRPMPLLAYGEHLGRAKAIMSDITDEMHRALTSERDALEREANLIRQNDVLCDTVAALTAKLAEAGDEPVPHYNPDEPALYVVAWEVGDADNMRWVLEDDQAGVGELLAWAREAVWGGTRLRVQYVYFTEAKWCSWVGLASGPGLVAQAMSRWVERSSRCKLASSTFGLEMVTDVELEP